MSGQTTPGEAYYRCRFPSEYAGAAHKHTNVVYLREADLLPGLDAWLLSVFDPKNIDGAVAALAAAQEPEEGALARAEAARRKLDDCDKRMGNLGKQIEGGSAPSLVVTWLREVEAERIAAERELTRTVPAAQPLTEAEIRAR